MAIETAVLSSAAVVRRATFVVEADVDGEIVVLDADTGECYGFDPIAAQIWKALAEPASVQSICSILLADYDVDRATCESQVLAFLEELRSEGVVELYEDCAT